MRLLLAPMEGLLDFVLRDVLTSVGGVGGVDGCVSEFIRISNTLLPERTFLRLMPELRQGSRTTSGVAVRAQLLGSDPVCMSENAARLAALNPAGIDLNFGCPAKTVNRHGGGASMLQDPEAIAKVVSAVRRALPPQMPLSAKMRLGFSDTSLMRECALAMAENGASQIVVHARTGAEGYRPPAHWECVAQIRQAVHQEVHSGGGLSTSIIANGEIWTVEDARRCLDVSGAHGLMLGRGMVADPALALAIRGKQEGDARLEWPQVLELMQRFWSLCLVHLKPEQCAGRLKQWLAFLRRRYPDEANKAFRSLRPLRTPSEVSSWFVVSGLEGFGGCASQTDLCF